jgi:hypothetical protein
LSPHTLPRMNACLMLAAVAWLCCRVEVAANDPIQPALRVNLSDPSVAEDPYVYGQGNTPIFFSPAEGQLVLLPGQFSTARTSALISRNDGQTWQVWTDYASWPKTNYCDVARYGNQWVAIGSESTTYDGTYAWSSGDQGRTWSNPVTVAAIADRCGSMNQRLLATSAGRIVLPVEKLLGAEGPGPNEVGTIYSDNGGQSWTRSPTFGPPAGYPTAPEGIGEPAVVELANGKTWMVARGLGGHLWQSFSSDGGATWGTPAMTNLVSPLSAVNAKRIPGADAVIAIWNNATPGTSTDWNSTSNVWRPRSPLVYAVSEDNCQTWSQPVVIASGAAAYPSIGFMDDKMFVSYWENPDPNGMWLSSDSHLEVIAYDVSALLAPEPSTFILAALGLLGLWVYAWRKRTCLPLRGNRSC